MKTTLTSGKRLLKPFGEGDTSYRYGYTFGVLLGHLESLANGEEERAEDSNGRLRKRYELVCDAIDLLNQAYEIGNES